MSEGDGGDPDVAMRRLRLDVDDLRYDNERLRASLAQKQEEILALSERLEALQHHQIEILRQFSGLGRLRRLVSGRLLPARFR